jgi:hypothetical protein
MQNNKTLTKKASSKTPQMAFSKMRVAAVLKNAAR